MVTFLAGMLFGGDIVMLVSIMLYAIGNDPPWAQLPLWLRARIFMSVLCWPFGLYVIWQALHPPPPPGE